ncbi:Homocysteine synthase [Bulinus truncatus]|nr:Homocysteine synthase [Bulinus truncatus]
MHNSCGKELALLSYYTRSNVMLASDVQYVVVDYKYRIMAVNLGSSTQSLWQPLKCCGRLVKDTLFRNGNRQKFSHRSLATSVSNDPCCVFPMKQVETPPRETLFDGSNQDNLQFKGLETDFPCLSRVKSSGPEPEYDNVTKGYKLFSWNKPFSMKLNKGVLPKLDIAYETWGMLNEDKSNAVLVLAGLSASSHARSSVDNMKPGWWERFIGPGCAVDTSKFFVICPNNLGGCYGSSGPSSINILTEKPFATTFPIIGIEDMTNAIFLLLDELKIDKLHGSVGSSLGGMLSLQSAVSYPERVGREIATITYRSGPEWDERFGRGRISDEPPSLCPTFLIESYLEHQGESFSTKYDPNSLLYMSKAMLFSL